MSDKLTNSYIGCPTAVEPSFNRMVPNQSTMKVSVGELLTTSRSLHDSFVASFKGIPLRVDSDLEGSGWYCSVSQKLFDEIKEKMAVKL